MRNLREIDTSILVLALFLASFCTIMVSVEATPFQWKIETIDETGNVGEFTSIAIDSNDHPHISYQDVTNSDLKYAWWNGSTWNIETVHANPTQNIGHYTSLALDSNDHRHISYWSLSTGDLYYATTFIDTLNYLATWGDSSFKVMLRSNATIAEFAFSQPDKRLTINVTVPSNLVGFCDMTIPTELLGGPFSVFINDESITPVETNNATHTTLYFTYMQDSQIDVIGTNVIPQFPTTITILIMLASIFLIFLFVKHVLVLRR